MEDWLLSSSRCTGNSYILHNLLGTPKMDIKVTAFPAESADGYVLWMWISLTIPEKDSMERSVFSVWNV